MLRFIPHLLAIHLRRAMSNRFSRGKHGGRGHYGRGNRDTHQRGNVGSSDAGASTNTGGGNDSRPRPPPGLKGREIGLFYASLQKKKTEEQMKKFEKDISISDAKIGEIREHLQNCSYFLGSEEKEEPETRQFRLDFARVTNIDMDEQISIAIGVKNKEDQKPSIFSADLNESLYLDYIQNKDKRPLQDFRTKLPSWSKRDIIVDIIRKNQVVLIKGETGCGKTTQVTQFILDEALNQKKADQCRIVCTQPRRISAITVAERVAAERGEKLGKSVGYHIRLECILPRKTGGSILYCTTGCVLKFLESDPALLNISHIILDEIHERDTHSDMLMAILKMIIKYRKDLKIILMSATLNADTFARYFNDCPVIEVEGLTFPVEEKYLEDVLHMLNYTNFQEPRIPSFLKHRRNYKDPRMELADILGPQLRTLRQSYGAPIVEALMNPASESADLSLIEELIFYISNKMPNGAILVFLPGYAKISTLCTNLQKSQRFPNHKYIIFPLHSLMTGADQKRVFNKPPNGVRKIIVATNIAETSITIDDIVYVINAGKRKMTSYDAQNNIQTLEEMWVSRANAKQRKGRAGRCQPGICYHLYSRARENTFETDIQPEIQRIRLDDIILSLKLLGIQDPKAFLFSLLSTPQKTIVEHSIDLLKRIEALTQNEKLTPLGYHLARLPVEPQTGKMILFGALFCCLDPITSIAASLSFRDAFYNVIGKEREVDQIKLEFSRGTKSDHLMLANVIKEYRDVREHEKFSFLRKNFLSRHTLDQLENMKQQFCKLLNDARFIENSNPKDYNSNRFSENLKVVKAIICSGLYPNIAKLLRVRRHKNHADATPVMETKEDGRCHVHLSSVNAKQSDFDSRYLVYFMKQKSTKIFIHDCTTVNPYSILFFGDMVEPNFEQNYISVANYMSFKCNPETQKLLLDLREGLNQLLKKKIWTPSVIDWDADEGALLKAVIHLITIDGMNPYDDYEDLDDEY